MRRYVFILFAVVLISCGQPDAVDSPVNEEAPESTPTMTAIPLATSVNTPIPTLIPIDESVKFVPRYMLPSMPGVAANILGKPCPYQRDNWNQVSAYIAYKCPDTKVSWISLVFTNFSEGETVEDIFGQIPPEGSILIPTGEVFSAYENLSVSARKANSEYIYFLIYETPTFVISSEVFLPENAFMTLEDFYSSFVEPVFYEVLEIVLNKARAGGAAPEPTPMSTDQQRIHDKTAAWLVTEAEANEFYTGAIDMFGATVDGTWVLMGDDVLTEPIYDSNCRKFEDRSNEDMPLVGFTNCVFVVGPEFELSELEENFANATKIPSGFTYEEPSIIYGYQNGSTLFQAFIHKGEYLLYVKIESRTKVGQTPEVVFNEFNDAFINSVFSINLDRFFPGESLFAETANENFLGTWVSIDTADGSNQRLEISFVDGAYVVYYIDEIATSCGRDADDNPIAADGTGSGTLINGVLTVDLTYWCLVEPKTLLATVQFEYRYNDFNNTLGESIDGNKTQTKWIKE